LSLHFEMSSVEATASTKNIGMEIMIGTSRRVSARWSLLTATILVATALGLPTLAFAQGPTDAQRAAVKSQCRSDYMAHCSSVTPGGAAALQCLQKNMASLSAGCRSAVRAVEASIEKPEPKADAKSDAKPESAPAAAAAKPEAEPSTTTAKPTAEAPPAAKPTATKAAGKPSDAQIAAIRSACRSDYPKVCAGVPTGGAPALQCLERNKAKLSAACEQAVAAASGSGTSTAAPAQANASPNAAPAAAPATAPLVLRPMRPREVLFVMRSACGADVRALCAGVDPGGGRIIECLAMQSASLSPACRGVLGQFAAR
jgi:hypothetical protein